jgi:hypothetical protein
MFFTALASLVLFLLTGAFAGTIPVIETIATGSVVRTSGKTDQSGRHVAPWKEVRIGNIFGFDRSEPC